MESWVQLVLAGVLGAVAGAVASIATAARIARGNEFGRVQEEARQQLLATVRLFRAHVAMERGDAGFRSAMDEDYLSATKRLRFAEDIEGPLAHVSPKLRSAVRTHVEKLCGPVDARSARLAAPLSVAERDTNWRTVYFLHNAEGLTEEQIKDGGLLGRAREARLIGDGVPEVLAELDAMESTLNRDVGWFGRLKLRRGHDAS